MRHDLAFSLTLPAGQERLLPVAVRKLAAMQMAEYGGDQNELDKVCDELVDDRAACKAAVGLLMMCMKAIGATPVALRELADSIESDIEKLESLRDRMEGDGGSEKDT